MPGLQRAGRKAVSPPHQEPAMCCNWGHVHFAWTLGSCVVATVWQMPAVEGIGTDAALLYEAESEEVVVARDTFASVRQYVISLQEEVSRLPSFRPHIQPARNPSLCASNLLASCKAYPYILQVPSSSVRPQMHPTRIQCL